MFHKIYSIIILLDAMILDQKEVIEGSIEYEGPFRSEFILNK